ncbi:MAG: S49 family peptidase, partial [Verrucomicrobiia bacterium]
RQPWLIQPEAIHAMADALGSGLRGTKGDSADILTVDDGIASVSIRGPIIRSADEIARIFFGAVSHEEVSEALSAAKERPDIRAVLLDIDSPGGTVAGTPELGAQVASLSKEKPVYAFSSGLMCSAAYWLASQAQAIYATASARVGSIGVLLPVVDSSEAFTRAGLKVEVFSVGKFKSMGTPGTSLNDNQRELIGANLREVAEDFHAAVLARGRSIPQEAMEGQDFSGKQAQKFNLAGLVPDRAEALRRLRTYHVARQLGSTRVDTATGVMDASLEDQLKEALANTSRLEADLTASSALADEAAAKADSLSAQVESLRTDLEAAQADAVSLRTEKEGLLAKLQEVETRNGELEAAEKDFKASVAAEAARIAAESGSGAPLPVTAKGDKPDAAPEASTQELIARFNELIAARKPQEAATFYHQHIAPLLTNR